jgi:hypothetical protein
VTTPLQTDALGFVDWRRIAGNAAAVIANGREGLVLTEAAARTPFVRNPAALRAAYEANPAALDAWARQLDWHGIVDAATRSDAVERRTAQLAPYAWLAGGLAAGYLLRSLL